MTGLARPIGLASLALALATTLTLASCRIERMGPERASYGNMCGPSHSEACMEPLLNGGFPFAYLFDAPGTSVEHQLSFGEDHFRWRPFALDVLFSLATLLLAAAIWRRLRRPARRSPSRA